MAEALAECRQVEGGLVVCRRMEHGGYRGHGDPVDRGGEEIGIAGHHVGVGGGDRVDQARAHRAVEGHPAPRLGQADRGRGQADLGVEVEVVELPLAGRREPVHGHPVEGGGARRLGVLPGEMIHGAAGEDLDLPPWPLAEALGQHPGRRLGPADHLGPVARRDEGQLHEPVSSPGRPRPPGADGDHRSRTATSRYSPGPSNAWLRTSMAALMAAASGLAGATWSSRRSVPP